MRTSVVFGAATTGVVLTLALTGCGDGGDGGSAQSSATPTPSASASGSAGGGSAPVCAVGDWRSTAARASGEAGGATGRITGGDGVKLNIDRGGRTKADFTGMNPLTFTASVLGATAKGQFSYSGTASADVSFPDGDSRTGTWEPTGQLDWGGMKVSAKLTEPAEITVADEADVSDLTGDKLTQTGNAVDLQPIFRKGTYTCEGDTLTITPQDSGPMVTWAFTKA